jgi:hypothetical protein
VDVVIVNILEQTGYFFACTTQIVNMPYTSERVKWQIVSWWELTHSIAEAARATNVTYNVAKRWIKRFLATNCGVECVAKSGRKCILSPDVQALAHSLLVEDKIGPANLVAQELLTRGATSKVVPKCTIIRAAKRIAVAKGEPIRALRGRPSKALSDATIQKRLNFCFANQTRATRRNVMFTDRKRFMFKFPGTCVHSITWVKRGERREAHTVNHPLCVNVYAGLTWHGVTKLHIVAGTSKHKTTFRNNSGGLAKNITQAEYECVLTHTLLPEGDRIFQAHGINSWVFQQDNDPSHAHAQSIIDGYTSPDTCTISLLKNWPPCSPDLSPIENLWGIIQGRIDAKGYKTFSEFVAGLHVEWHAATSEHSRSLLRSVRSRIKQCIDCGGKKTKY